MQSSITKKQALRDLIESTDWVSLEKQYEHRGIVGLHKNEIAISFTPSGKATLIDRVIIRVGKDVMRELDWTVGDRVLPMFHTDDQLIFRIIKAERGYNISKDNLPGYGRIQFTWRGDIKLQRMSTSVQKHEVYNNQLIFRVGNWADAIV